MKILLSSQKVSNNHFGIDFSKEKEMISHAHGRTNHALVQSYVKNNSNNFSGRPKYKYIWVPKYLNSFDKNTYIASYINTVCNSIRYVYVNKWKSNSKWI